MIRSTWERARWSLGERLAESAAWQVVLRYDGPAPAGERYINRLNGHVVLRQAATRNASR